MKKPLLPPATPTTTSLCQMNDSLPWPRPGLSHRRTARFTAGHIPPTPGTAARGTGLDARLKLKADTAKVSGHLPSAAQLSKAPRSAVGGTSVATPSRPAGAASPCPPRRGPSAASAPPTHLVTARLSPASLAGRPAAPNPSAPPIVSSQPGGSGRAGGPREAAPALQVPPGPRRAGRPLQPAAEVLQHPPSPGQAGSRRWLHFYFRLRCSPGAPRDGHSPSRRTAARAQTRAGGSAAAGRGRGRGRRAGPGWRRAERSACRLPACLRLPATLARRGVASPALYRRGRALVCAWPPGPADVMLLIACPGREGREGVGAGR